MPFITAGFPSLDATARTIPELQSGGASIVELGFPFSDPIADGPVIAASMHEALQHGATPAAIFDLVRNVRPQTTLGLVAMVSISIMTRMGPKLFIQEAAHAGFDGLIVPDLDPNEAQALFELAGDSSLSFSMLIAPTTPPQRIKAIVRTCSGFAYVLARTGITGERDAAPYVSERVKLIRSMTDLPIAVGFGISTAEHVAAVTAVADAAIVGSALVRRMGEANDPAAAAGRFTAELAAGLARRQGQPSRPDS